MPLEVTCRCLLERVATGVALDGYMLAVSVVYNLRVVIVVSVYLNGIVNELLDVHLHPSTANGASVSVQMMVSHLIEISVLGTLYQNLRPCVRIHRCAIIVLVPMHKPCLLNEFLGSQPVGIHTAALVASLSVKVVVRTL